MRALVAILVLLITSSARAQPAQRVATDRSAYVSKALAAVKALGDAGRTKLDRDLYAATRSRCRADDQTPAASCLVEVARGICAGDATCLAAADVVATNLRGTNELLDEAARMRILRKSRDYRADLTAELAKRYAVLAAELVLASPSTGTRVGDEATAVAIDQLCTQRDREIRACEPGATACMPSVPWSRCVAMLVWFVGGNAR